ncbi:MAG: hypothetical protein A2Z20_12115, partial [Bdellovibrionales bacterium RBG_16_40_8]
MTTYLIVGSGLLAKHLAHYLDTLRIPFLTWSRNSPETTDSSLEHLAKKSDRILLLISDNEIANFVKNHKFLLQKKLIHCSGALTFSFAESAHPLNTFGPDLYEQKVYLNTPFILESGRTPFSELLPGLSNPHYFLTPEKKALYHSLCVMAGNFTTLLWQNVFKLFEEDLKLPHEVLLSYLDTVATNLKLSPKSALTGPIARRDTQTIIRNLDSLAGR